MKKYRNLSAKRTKKGWPGWLWIGLANDVQLRLSSEVRETSVSVDSQSYRIWQSVPVPRSMIVSLVAFSQPALPLVEPLYDKCSVVYTFRLYRHGVRSLVNTVDRHGLLTEVWSAKCRVSRSFIETSECVHVKLIDVSSSYISGLVI